jgi:hypothetical protein
LAEPAEVEEEILEEEEEEEGTEALEGMEEVGQEEQVDTGIQVIQVASAGQVVLAPQEVVDTAAMAGEEDQEIPGIIPLGVPPTTPCLNLRAYLAC